MTSFGIKEAAMTLANADPAPEQTARMAMAGTPLADFLQPLGRLHAVLCPRQVLGVRSALLAGHVLELDLPRTDKRLIALAEIDGCYTDGVLVASGCSVGHRTLRVIELGKVAVTFFDTETRVAVRVWPGPGVRERAAEYAPGAASRWHAERDGYARMPEAKLLRSERVTLAPELQRELLQAWDKRTTCERCGEDVFYGRQLCVDGRMLCRACAGSGYLDRAR
jgi:formylmethanofuran dehydrogenase subunit E